jgi:hypothetical protein
MAGASNQDPRASFRARLAGFEPATRGLKEAEAGAGEGKYWQARGPFEKAKILLEEQLQTRRDVPTLMTLANLHLSMDENEEAERLLSQVRDQEPGSVQSLVGLAAVAARIALILLVLVQLNFFVGHVGVQLEALVYFPLTLGLLLFIIAAFYLPQPCA